ncbi:hypothetical protein CRG98_019002 [Punica granatum]|uniref:Reverse transcriptase zinc-binding domain-containing protein n=1 Tax=Punica granatum TaxID=22663 RepID=A0A2I0JYK2_PUNGR|nr:hypothetical protein CRG98_019002 [Punica granatum]
MIDHSTLLRVAAQQPPVPELGDDCISWALEPSGIFSVKTTYSLLAEPLWSMEEPIWRLVWQWRRPQRIQIFLWLVAHEKLLTNSLRVSRHLAVSGLCDFCSSTVETILHVLRDCPSTRSAWYRLVPMNIRGRFFLEPLKPWLILNPGSRDEKWATLFGVACWLFWGWRNKGLFKQDFVRPRDEVQATRATTHNFEHARDLWSNTTQPRREWRWIQWRRPPPR